MTDEVASLQTRARHTVAEAQHLFENDFYEGSTSPYLLRHVSYCRGGPLEGPLARAMNEYAKLRSGAKIEMRP